MSRTKALEETSVIKRKNYLSFEKNRKRRLDKLITTEMQELKLNPSTTHEKMEFDEIGGQDHKIDICSIETKSSNHTTKDLIDERFGPSCSDQKYNRKKKEQQCLKRKKPTQKEKIEFLEVGEQDREIDCRMKRQTLIAENHIIKDPIDALFGPSCSSKNKPIKTEFEESCETWGKFEGPKPKRKPGEQRILNCKHLTYLDSSDSDQDLSPNDGKPSAIPWEKNSTNVFEDDESKNDFPFNKILTPNEKEKSFYRVIRFKNESKEPEE